MRTITREWLQKAINQHESMRDEIPFGLDEDDSNTLAALRIALASLEAEPVVSHIGSKNALDAIVAFIKSNRNPTLKDHNEVSSRLFQDNCHGLSNHVIEYIKQIGDELEELRSAQDTDPPAPATINAEPVAWLWSNRKHPSEVTLVRPEDDEKAEAAQWSGWSYKALYAEPVTTAYKLPDDFDFDRFNDVVWLEAVASNPRMHSLTTSTIAMMALELNKRLETGDSPVSQDGWVACSERMPEDEQEVITHNIFGYRHISFFDEHSGHFFDRLDGSPVDCVEHVLVSHWMPLPAAPKQEVKS